MIKKTPQSAIDKAYKFACELTPKRFERWNKKNPKLTYESAFNGVVAGYITETAARAYIKSLGYKVSEVDSKTYDDLNSISWIDLKLEDEGKPISVKSLSINNTLVFEKTDHILVNSNSDGYVIGVKNDLANKNIEILCCVPDDFIRTLPSPLVNKNPDKQAFNLDGAKKYYKNQLFLLPKKSTTDK